MVLGPPDQHPIAGPRAAGLTDATLCVLCCRGEGEREPTAEACMRFRVYIATSADGFIATKDGSVQWLMPFQELDYGYQSFIDEIDVIIMGRKTYEQVAGHGPWPYAGREVFVLGRRPLEDPPADTVQWTEGVDALLRRLRRSSAEGDVWIVGGAQTIAAFRERDAIDAYELFVMPVSLGDGIRLFDPVDVVSPLRFDRARAYKNGVLRLEYGVPR